MADRQFCRCLASSHTVFAVSPLNPWGLSPRHLGHRTPEKRAEEEVQVIFGIQATIGSKSWLSPLSASPVPSTDRR